jgi:hypothetical protein
LHKTLSDLVADLALGIRPHEGEHLARGADRHLGAGVALRRGEAPPINSYALFEQLPDTTLILYPDSGHGALFQYSDEFVREGLQFLGA